MSDPREYRFGPFRLDVRRQRLFEGTCAIHLKPKEWQLLCYLVEHPGRLIPKDELIDDLWPRQCVTEANLNQTVYRVRQALGDSAQAARWIETKPRAGYCFVGEVEETTAGNQQPWPRTLAVLPFVDCDSGETSGAWSLGLADALIHALSADSTLVVRPLGAVIHEQVGRGASAGPELDVEAVIDGTIQSQAGESFIQARLLESNSGQCRWTRSWTLARTLTDTDRFAAQREIADDVRAMLKQRGAVSGDARAARKDQPPGAYASYLRGRYCWHQFTEPALHRSLELFDEALVLEPRFAEAHAWRSAAWSALGNIGALSPRASAEQARRAADRAIAIDDQLAVGFEMRGVVELYFDWNFEAAMRSFERAIERDPQSANAHHLRGNALAFTGHTDDALRDLERALQIDPTALIAQTDAGFVQYLSGRFDEARRRLDAALSQNPHFSHARLKLAFVLAAQGHFEAALRETERVAQERASDRFGEMAWSLGLAGRGAQARRLITRLGETCEADALDPLEVALGHLGVGDTDACLAWLERAEAYRSRQLAHLAVDPVWRPLHQEQAFHDLVRRVGLKAVD